MEVILRKIIIPQSIYFMFQKSIDPFKFKKLEVYPGIEVRKDTVINIDATFKIEFTHLRKYLLNQILIKMSQFDYYNLRRIKSLYNVNSYLNLEDSAFAITDLLVTDISVIIKNLTLQTNQYDLMKSIKSNVTCLPDFILRIIKHINSCNLTTHITGTEASLFNFKSLKVELTDKNIGSHHTHAPEFTLSRILKTNEAFSLLGFELMSEFTGIQDLFGMSDDLLNVCIISENKGSYKIGIPEGHDKEDLIHALLCLPNFKLSDESIRRIQEVDITNSQINDIFNIPFNMLVDPSINHVSTRKLVNDYIDSKIPTRIGEEPIQKGFKKKEGYQKPAERLIEHPKYVKKGKKAKGKEDGEGVVDNDSDVSDLNNME
jgi:hypothetical protein